VGKRTRQSVRIQDAFVRPVDVVFDGEALTSDAGLLLLRSLDERLGVTRTLARCLEDRRDPRKVAHRADELFRQRVYAIAGGYPDGNDAAVLGDDPVLKEVCGRRGMTGARLASQPTASRFENAVTGRELVHMGRALERFVIERHRKRLHGQAKLVTIDLDPTPDRTYGQQTFSFFSGCYEAWCYQPQLGFLSFDGEHDQHLFHARLRPGNARCWRGAFNVLTRTVAHLREAFPGVKIRVRLDAGFNTPRTFAVLEDLGVEYVVAMPSNKRLERLAEPYLVRARRLAEEEDESARVFGEFRYAPLDDAWPHQRRVVVKAEVVVHSGREPKDNPRYVATNVRWGAQNTYESFYCGRGDVENRTKELNLGLALGRTSCTRFLANQLRVLMTAAAYVLFQALRHAARDTVLARAQVPTLRDRLLKIGARVVQSVRRLVVHMPAACPSREVWLAVARVVVT
jgi:Transposase DDE domain group 1